MDENLVEIANLNKIMRQKLFGLTNRLQNTKNLNEKDEKLKTALMVLYKRHDFLDTLLSK